MDTFNMTNTKDASKLISCKAVIKGITLYLVVPDDYYSEYQENIDQINRFMVKVVPSTIYLTMKEYLESNEEFKKNKERWVNKNSITSSYDLHSFCLKVVKEFSKVIPYYHKDFAGKDELLSWIIEDCVMIIA